MSLYISFVKVSSTLGLHFGVGSIQKISREELPSVGLFGDGVINCSKHFYRDLLKKFLNVLSSNDFFLL